MLSPRSMLKMPAGFKKPMFKQAGAVKNAPGSWTEW